MSPLLFTILLAATIIWCPGIALAEGPSANQSQLLFKENPAKRYPDDYLPSHVCYGAVPRDVGLEQIGLSSEQLRKGAECVAGDFDGNGSIDFALYQEEGQHSNVLFYVAAKVVFFDGKRVIRVSTLKDPPTNLWRKGSDGPCFRNSSKTDGLMVYGNGELDRTLLFNSISGEWKADQCGGENAE